MSCTPSGELAKDILIWKEGMGEWLPVSAVPEFSQGDGSMYAAPQANPVGQAARPQLVVPTSGLAIASLVCGIVSLLACYFNGLFGIPAVICGHMAMKRTGNPQSPVQGRGMAIAGLICGYIGILIQVFFIFVIVSITTGSGIFAKAVEEEIEKIKQQQEELQREQEEAEEALETFENE